jgi:hypothetical protein
MTRKQRPRPSGSSDRLLPILTKIPTGQNTVTQQADEVPPARPAQFQKQVARPQAPLRERVQHIQQAKPRVDSAGITPLHVERTYDDLQIAHTASEAEISVTKPDIQRVQQAPLRQARVNAVDPGPFKSNPRVEPRASSTVAALTDRIRAAENQLYAEKQRSAILGKALIGLQVWSNKLCVDREAWKKSAGHLEEEVRSFKRERALSGEVDIPPHLLDYHSMPYVQAGQSQSWMGSGGANPHAGPAIATTTCEACRLRQLRCTSIQDHSLHILRCQQPRLHLSRGASSLKAEP